MAKQMQNFREIYQKKRNKNSIIQFTNIFRAFGQYVVTTPLARSYKLDTSLLPKFPLGRNVQAQQQIFKLSHIQFY